jgi:hypothetical protein
MIGMVLFKEFILWYYVREFRTKIQHALSRTIQFTKKKITKINKEMTRFNIV